MWIGKWVIAMLFEGKGFLDFLMVAIKLRASTGGSDRFIGLKNCFRGLFENRFLDMALLFLIGLTCAENIISRRKITVKTIRRCLFCMIPAAIWYIAFSNHVFVHSWFTYRHTCVIIPAILAALDLKGKDQSTMKGKII